MKNIIIGAGDFGREIFALINDFKSVSNNEFGGYLDDDLSKPGVIGPIKDHKIITDAVYICAIGDGETRLRICQEFLNNGAIFPTLIHSSVVLTATASVGYGSIIFPGCYIANNAKIGNFVIILFTSGAGHDSIIGDGSTICSHCDVTGNVVLGKCIYMASGSTICPGKKIGDNVKIGIGSAVTRNFPTATTVMGVPAKRIVF